MELSTFQGVSRMYVFHLPQGQLISKNMHETEKGIVLESVRYRLVYPRTRRILGLPVKTMVSAHGTYQTATVTGNTIHFLDEGPIYDFATTVHLDTSNRIVKVEGDTL